MPNDDDLLNQQLEQPVSPLRPDWPSGQPSTPSLTSAIADKAEAASATVLEFRQWQIGANDTFRPAGLTREHLPSGIYKFAYDNSGIYISRFNVVTDSLVPLPDTANERVLAGMRVFWERADLYRRHGLLYKRGVLLWGPPGSGKTATLALLAQQLIQQNGLVVVCQEPELCSAGLATLRRIEPSRRLICIIEDIDEVIGRFGEHALLALLDGENQVDNIVMVATTNYPERLGARIVNRPSRFDERILVGMPSPAARRVYLERVTSGLEPKQLNRWVGDTDGLSIAHLRELTASVLCLGQDYQSVLERLRSMRHRIRERDGGDGFAAQAVTGFN